MRVGIDHLFFAKGLRDYTDWRWAWVREIAQNSIDAGSKSLRITIETRDGKTIATASNDGPPMSKAVLLDKFLCLGGTTKNFEGTVGGFGIAKTVLCLAHPKYEINTGSHLVVGSGGDYELGETEYLSGTKTTVWFDEDCTTELCSAVFKFASECQWQGELRLNGKLLSTNLKKGSRRRDLGWAVVYTNKTFPGRLIVRVDGMPMFSRYVNHDRCVVVEVNRTSGQALTSNRDGLTWEYRSKLESFVDQISVDKVSALREHPVTTYHHFDGEKHSSSGSEVIKDLVSAAYATMPQVSKPDPEEGTETLAVDQQVGYSDGPSFAEVANRLERGRCGYEFVVKNNTDLNVPDHFLPWYFSAYSRKLVSVWIKCLLELHELFGHKDSFAVGFILDSDREAEFEVTQEYGRVYYINPAVIVEQQFSKSRSLKKRWLFNNAGKYALLAVAAHEFVHGLGFSPHDEGYANKQTTLMGIAMANKKRFHPCFR
jgi:hypothetical protein